MIEPTTGLNPDNGLGARGSSAAEAGAIEASPHRPPAQPWADTGAPIRALGFRNCGHGNWILCFPRTGHGPAIGGRCRLRASCRPATQLVHVLKDETPVAAAGTKPAQAAPPEF